MRAKISTLTNFTNAIHRQSPCFRPENEQQLEAITQLLATQAPLARGAGMSYSDGCINENNPVIDCTRLNHFISFDENTGLLVCQPGITFAELFTVHPEFIPPVIPGTLKATLGGGIANDIHGKNNAHAGTLGHHIEWLELQVGNRHIYCSRTENQALFSATLGGLGLTGVIKRLAITLKNASHCVEVSTKRMDSWSTLLQQLQQDASQYEYQVAWLDLLNPFPRAILSQANHCNTTKHSPKSTRSLKIPKLPCRLINRFSMTQFNRLYYRLAKDGTQVEALTHFNNPLDKINHWNRLYGKQGLLQFQAVFNVPKASETLAHLIKIIQSTQATPTLAVLKHFAQSGTGLLSFVKPGYTLAIDFINNPSAVKAIQQLNEIITNLGEKVYLGKDLFLTPEQFKKQYPNEGHFNRILAEYQCGFESDQSRRLGLGACQ